MQIAGFIGESPLGLPFESFESEFQFHDFVLHEIHLGLEFRRGSDLGLDLKHVRRDPSDPRNGPDHNQAEKESAQLQKPHRDLHNLLFLLLIAHGAVFRSRSREEWESSSMEIKKGTERH